ncbi:MAG: hypothetical protein COA49_07600 [Bacteroidetes bacterium]|nr:MAG: hypothetical protein COA49_07600 [Bacteroidota bacterium]
MSKNREIARALIVFSIITLPINNLAQTVQTQNLSDNFSLSDTFNWNVSGRQLVWGVKWHSINFEKSIRVIPGGVLCGSWQGWEAWRESSLMWRQEKLLGVTAEGQKVYSWLQIGGHVGFLPELNSKQLSVISQIGIYMFSSEGSFEASLSPEFFRSNRLVSKQRNWPWDFSGSISTVEMNGVEIGLGMYSSLKRNSWRLSVGRQIDSFKVQFMVEGPSLFFSCTLQWQREFNLVLVHESSVIGNVTKWGVKW